MCAAAMSASRRCAALAALLLAGATAGATDRPAFAPRTDLPIDLDAASSEFDRRNERLVFRNLKITQGPMRITADLGEATRVDFENARWIFRGNVVIDNQGARVYCDEAELTFVGHELRSAALTGKPARFEHLRGGAQRTEGHSGLIEYDVTAATIRLSHDAWLSDGANEVSGDRIAYDLRREYVTADAGGSGQVRMRIKPPERNRQEEAAP